MIGASELGRIQVLRLSWDTENKRWFYLTPPDVKYKLDPDDPLHWTGIGMCWNTNCADCHSTNVQKNFDTLTKNFHTTFSEIDVSCEACHGPGSTHVDWANQAWWNRSSSTGLVSLKKGSALLQIETCAPCHSRRAVTQNDFRPGCSYSDYFAHELVVDGSYHHDGQIRDEVYVYGSFVQSKMFHQGIRCTDCHDPHSTKIKHEGNLLCTSCHAHPAGKYDTPQHHHHKIGSPGSFCVDCHMPETTYMDVDPRRDHSLRIPRPDLSVKFGTPNACTGCHIDIARLPQQDRTDLNQYLDWIIASERGNQSVTDELARVDQWMLDSVVQWYGPRESDTPHYYEAIAQVRSDPRAEMELLARLMNDRTVPAILRATAAQLASGHNSDVTIAAARQALSDEDPTVVANAVRTIDGEIGRQADIGQYVNSARDRRDRILPLARPLIPLLSHESRQVRTQAARVLVSVPEEIRSGLLSGSSRNDFDEAFKELRQSLLLNNDRSGAHLTLSTLYLQLGDFENAVKTLRNAVGVDPNVSGSRTQLASLLEQQAQTYMSQAQRAASNQNRESAQRYAERAADLNREALQLREADHQLLEKELARSAHLPNTHSIHYRLGMSHYLRGDIEKTEYHLLAALSQRPRAPVYLLAAATLFKARLDWQQAHKYARELVDNDPEHVGYQRLLEEISRQLPGEDNSGTP